MGILCKSQATVPLHRKEKKKERTVSESTRERESEREIEGKKEPLKAADVRLCV